MVKKFDCDNANHCVNIKNLLEYTPMYSNSVATNEFYFLDTWRAAQAVRYTTRRVQHGRNDADGGWEERNFVDGTNADCNQGYSARKALLGEHVGTVVNTEIPLNRYSFFESLENKLLPNSRVDLDLKIESDNNLIWKTGADNVKVVITRMQLYIPKITSNPEGQTLYMEQYLKPQKWTYLKEVVEKMNSTLNASGNFRITTGISKPRHVFVFILNDAKLEAPLQNQFLYDTFSVSNNNTRITDCQLEIANGIEYPEVQYTPNSDISRIYRDVLKYVHLNNDYQGGTLLNRANFESLFPFLYFDLTKQKLDIIDGTTKINFKYHLSAAAAADNSYSIYAIILHEQDIEIQQKDKKLFLRS